MLTLSTFLTNYKGTYFLIRNREGDILYPSDKKAVNFFEKVLTSYSDENDFYNYQNSYFRYNSQTMNDNDNVYIVESLEDVTRFEKQSLRAMTDVTTNLGGKRLTFEQFNVFIMDSIYLGRPFCSIVADADNFKMINDCYGHLCGDEMLKHLGKNLFDYTRHKNLNGNHVCRGVDIVGRIGGEEFLIVLNSVSLAGAYNVIEKIRKGIENSSINYEGKTIPSCTMSFGMHYVDVEELNGYKESGNYGDEETADEIRKVIMDKCDKALYVSKNTGKNRISVYGIGERDDLLEAITTKRCPIDCDMFGQKRIRTRKK